MKNVYILFLFALMMLNCSNNKKESEEPMNQIKENDKYISLGNQIATETGKTLSSELLNKINSEGAESAVAYCNLQALPLTAQLESKYNVRIKRIGSRVRNVANAADAIEKEVINMFGRNLEKGNDTRPVVMKINNEYHYFNYIMTKPLCLNCHGKPVDNINENVFKKINNLYPADEAINYKDGDFRGIWHIIFKNN